MSTTNKPGLDTLVTELDRQPIDRAIERRLARARAHAISQSRRPPSPGWLPGATFATAVTVAVLLTIGRGSPTPAPDLSSDPSAAIFVFSGEDAELADEIEFYDWLESSGHAG